MVYASIYRIIKMNDSVFFIFLFMIEEKVKFSNTFFVNDVIEINKHLW